MILDAPNYVSRGDRPNQPAADSLLLWPSNAKPM